MSAKSRLPVVMYERNAADLATSFPDALLAVLLQLGLAGPAVEREVLESREIIVAATDSRSMLGSLNDFAMLATHRLRAESVDDLANVSAWLARTPIAPLGYRCPLDVAEELLG